MEVVRAFTTNNLHTEIIIKGTYEDPLFRASDIGEVLGITNIRVNLQHFDGTEKVNQVISTSGGNQEVSFLTEKGLYKILFRSRKPIAEEFQNWICDIMKDIRLNGKYQLEKEIIDQHQKEAVYTIATNRQQQLLRDFGNIGSIIYIIKVHTYETGEYVIKIGESRIGVQARYNEHRTKFGNNIMLLDCFKVKKYKEFESFIHTHDSIRGHRSMDLPGHETERELFHIGKGLTYQTIIHIIHANIKTFNEYSEKEIDALRVENDTLKSLISGSGTGSNTGSESSASGQYVLLQEILQIQKDMAARIESLEKTNQLLMEKAGSSHTIKTATNFNTPLITLGPRLQQINPETMTLYKTYESIADCIKTYNYKMKRPSIVKAIEENTIYNGYRWAYVDRDSDPNNVVQLAPTKKTFVRINGYVAKIHENEIVSVFLDRKTACSFEKYKISALDTPVKNKTPYNGFLYMLYDDCDDELKDAFVEKYGIPVLYKSGVGQFDVNNQLVNEYICKYDCIKQMSFSDKTLAKTLDTEMPYNGYVFRSLGDKLVVGK